MSTSRYDGQITRPSVESLRNDLGYPVRMVGFWTAVLIPFVLLGLLAVGIAQQSPLLLGSLLVANLTGLVLGRDHKR